MKTLWQCTLYDDLIDYPYADWRIYATKEEAEKRAKRMTYTDDGVRYWASVHQVKGCWKVKPPRTDISDKTYAKINEFYRSMPLADRRMINPDISDEPQDYFKDAKYYHDNTAFNAVSDHGFIIAEKVPSDQNIDGTHGVEIGIGVTEKGRGVGTGLTKDLVDWFDSQDEYDVMWWPVDKRNKGSIRVAEKNGFIKDPLGDNYIYVKESALENLGIGISVRQQLTDVTESIGRVEERCAKLRECFPAEMGKNRGRICPTCGCIVFDDEECCPDCNAEVDG